MEKLRITVNNKTYEVLVEVLENDGRAVPAGAPPAGQHLAAIDGGKSPAVKNSPAPDSGGAKQFCAPMPGTVLDIRIKKGDSVKEGDVLMILEAMKMENELLADVRGRVDEIHVSKGQAVQAGDRLVSLVD